MAKAACALQSSACSNQQEPETCGIDQGSRDGHRHPSSGPLDCKPECDARKVQQSGRQREPDRICDRISQCKQLRSVRVTMEDREHSYDRRGQRQ